MKYERPQSWRRDAMVDGRLETEPRVVLGMAEEDDRRLVEGVGGGDDDDRTHQGGPDSLPL